MSTTEVGTLRTRLSFEEDAGRGLKGFKDDLKGLRSEMNVARSHGREYTQSLRGMGEQSDILTRRFKTQQAQVKELHKRYEESRKEKGADAEQTRNLQNQYNNATAQMNRTEQQLKTLTAEIQRQQSPWTRLSEEAEKHGKKLQSVGREITSFGKSYTMRVTTPILGAAGAALKVGMDFEEGMSKVRAIAQPTGAEFQRLEKMAMEMGSTTRFSATEAASGMEYLARAGFEVNEISEAMPGLLDLAASANMDLGRAADITSNIISGFGMEASEAGRVADILAKASSTANTDVNGLGAAMEVVAPVAATLGLRMEDLAAATGTMADAGIDGSQAGRMLRQGMLRLANPTGKAAELLEDLKINVFDANGEMKQMPTVVDELSKGLEGMSADARTAALATIFGSESTAGWSALLERGADDLGDYTKELRESEGAASDMAAIMEDNAKGSMREFRSALEGAGIAASRHMIPAITTIIERVTALIRRFGELDEEQQEQIIKWALIAASVGPASLVLGNLTTTLGGTLRAVSAVSSGIVARGGLVAALGSLTNPVTAAIAITGALAGGIYLWNRRTAKAAEVNLDLANSMIETADTLDDAVTRYDKLRRASGLSTDQIGDLLDTQQRMESETDPSKIKDLEEAYEELKKESGLSNEQLDELLKLNDQIIKQTPDVETTFSDRGNAIVDSTEKVYDHIAALRNMAIEELQLERIKFLEQERDILDENTKKKERLEELDERGVYLRDLYKLTEDEIADRIVEINGLLNDSKTSNEELVALDQEKKDLIRGQQGGISALIQELQDEAKEINETLEKNDEKLRKINEIDDAISSILLLELGINEQGERGVDLADEQLKKYREQRKVLEEQIAREGDKGGILQDQLDYVNDQIGAHERILGQIEKETRLSSEALGEREYQVNEVNKKIREGYRISDDMNEILSRDITKNVTVTDNGTLRELENQATRTVSKRVNFIPQGSGAVPLPMYKDGVGKPGEANRIIQRLNDFSRLNKYAASTYYHPENMFVAGGEL